MDERNETLASEIYSDLKNELKFKNRLIIGLIAALIASLVVLNVYHNWLWSQFDTVVLDSGDGYSNLVQGDVGGGIYNGLDKNTSEEGR